VIRTTLVLPALPDVVDAVIGVYNEHDILQYSLDNSEAVASELSVATDGSGAILVTAVWPSTEAYQCWLDNPERERTGTILRELLKDAVGVGQTWKIDQSVSK